MSDASAPPAPSPYSDLSSRVTNAIDELNADTELYVPSQGASELFRLDDKVQLFFVTGDGKVSTFSEPVSLRIFRFDQAEASDDSTTVFLQVGGWTHPLVAGASPCLQAENGAIMFPDIYSDLPNSSVGLVLLDDVDPETRTELIAKLQELTAFKSEPTPPNKADYNLGRVGTAIVSGAELVSKGIGVGSEKAGQLIVYVTERSQEKLAKGEQDARVGPLTKGSIKVAKSTTNATVKVSGFVAKRVGNLTKSLADYLAAKAAPPPDRSGAVVAAAGGGSGKVKPGAMSYLMDAARGGLIAYGTIYENLEVSAKELGTSLKANSVKVMQHRYGAEAADTLGEAMTAAGNGALTYMNIQSLGAKGIVKSAAKQTGKQVVKNVIDSHHVEKEGAQPAIQQ